MDNNENYNNKIENLINAFSELTDEDIEEAKAVIRAAGKNPEEILERGLKRLQNVKEKIRRAKNSSLKGRQLNYSYPVFIYDEVENLIRLTDHPDLHRLLTLREIYEILMAGEGLKNSPLENSKIAPEVKNWRFQRLSKEIVFEINILPEFAEVKALLKVAEKFELTLDAVETAIQTGYYNAEGRCYPIDSESLDFAREFLGWLDDDKHLSVYKALNLYSSKNDWRLLKFTQEQFDLQVILNSGAFQTTTTLFTQELYDYQEDGLRWLLHRVINRLGGILADDMGLGKTAQIIALIANVLERKLLERILIVVPSTLLENWRREFLFFAPQIVPYIHHGFGRSGSPALLQKHQVIITSYSMIINDEFLFNKIQWGLTILDEASLIKNPESERRIALKGLDSIVKIAMTGTPVENSLIDLWSIADYVYPGYLGTKAEFTTKYISRDIVQTLDSGNLIDLRNYISFIMLRRKKRMYLTACRRK
ncbi:DEAD/DEAH box helicase [Arcticibacter sp. MXS-1]|uniref:DEAD/DEAH box helicase n=1 Tax=Arcticibacter sp. MXS-1 TaxID=3341726 RepID=UPI0035A8A9D5